MSMFLVLKKLSVLVRTDCHDVVGYNVQQLGGHNLCTASMYMVANTART